MEVLKFTNMSMIAENINNQTYFFTISHITKDGDDKHIYGIRLNNASYFLSKTTGLPDGMQIDVNQPLPHEVLSEINIVITTMELKYQGRQSLDLLNREIFRSLIKLRGAA